MELLFIIPHNNMILKKYRLKKNTRPRIRLRYFDSGMYCIGCVYYNAVCCSLPGEEKDPKRHNFPKVCLSDMKRWAHGGSKFIYHAV